MGKTKIIGENNSLQSLKVVISLLLFLLLSGFEKKLHAQSLSPSVISSAGNYHFNSGFSLSSTLGEPMNATYQNGNVMLTQGQQQHYITLRLLHLKAFIQGYYIGGGEMQAVLHNNFPADFDANSCDSILVELHQSTSPFETVESKYAILQTDGNAELHFLASQIIGEYYIVLRHRNSIATWSKFPVSFNSSQVIYDFSAP